MCGPNRRAALLAGALLAAGPAPARAELAPVGPESAAGRRLVDLLRTGGRVAYVRHADTRGMPCDRVFDVARPEGQRNLSPVGRDQARRLGQRFAELRLPVERPVLAGPVARARDTAELAFGREEVRVVEGLTADDFAGARLGDVIAEHRRLMSEPVAPSINRVLVGHRTPAIMILGSGVGGRAFPEGGLLVLTPRPPGPPNVEGVLELAPLPGGGFHDCG